MSHTDLGHSGSLDFRRSRTAQVGIHEKPAGIGSTVKNCTQVGLWLAEALVTAWGGTSRGGLGRRGRCAPLLQRQGPPALDGCRREPVVVG